jgi:hypothetical protein
MSRAVILPKTDDEIKEERKEWREERKIKQLEFIAEQSRLAAERTSYVSSGIRDLEKKASGIIRSTNDVVNRINALRVAVEIYALTIIFFLMAITLNLFFY